MPSDDYAAAADVLARLPEDFAALRAARGMTYRQVGAIVGVHISFLCNIEHRRVNPGIQTAERLLRWMADGNARGPEVKPPEGMTFERIESDDPNYACWKVTAPTVIHRCPPAGQGITPCCERTPFELPRWHRMTLDDSLVTCSRPDGTARNAEPGTE